MDARRPLDGIEGEISIALPVACPSMFGIVPLRVFRRLMSNLSIITDNVSAFDLEIPP